MTRRILPALLALALALSACASAPPPADPLAAIMARHDASIGGRAALEAVQAIEVELTIAEPTYTARGVYRADRKGRMRIDVYMPGPDGERRVFTEAYDGHAGWQMDGKGKVTPSSPAGSAALAHGIYTPDRLYGLHELAALGTRIAYDGEETIDGKRYAVLKLTMGDGFETWRYLDAATGLIVRSRDHRAFHVDLDPTKKDIETVATDFRVVGGVLRPFLTTDRDQRTGQVLATNTVRAIRTPAAFDDALFAMPTGG